MQALIPQLESIFRDVFNDPNLVVQPETVASDVPDWDSLSNINLIFAIESEFKVRFALGEIQELKNVSEMAALIVKKKGLART
jgi:acyl carrier protein